MKKTFAAVSALLILMGTVCFAGGCKKDNDTVTTKGTYVYTPSGSGSQETTRDPESELLIDMSWKNNYSVTYDYYNSADSEDTLGISEVKNENAFRVEYLDNSSTLFYKQNGSDIDYYVVVPGEKNQAHSLIKSKNISALSSMFMKLTKVDADMSTQSNVLFMYNEKIAGRDCLKYIQRAYSGGELTESVYVWIDAEFGFAAKCEAYDANDKLTTMWEVKSFETGSVKDEDVTVDISGYKIVEE